MKNLVVSVLGLLAAQYSHSQLTAADRAEVLRLTGTTLREQYIHPDKGMSTNSL